MVDDTAEDDLVWYHLLRLCLPSAMQCWMKAQVNSCNCSHYNHFAVKTLRGEVRNIWRFWEVTATASGYILEGSVLSITVPLTSLTVSCGGLWAQTMRTYAVTVECTIVHSRLPWIYSGARWQLTGCKTLDPHYVYSYIKIRTVLGERKPNDFCCTASIDFVFVNAFIGNLISFYQYKNKFYKLSL